MKPGTRLGQVAAPKSGSTTTAWIDGVLVQVEVARDLTVAAGDVVLVDRFGSQWFVVARFYPGAVALPDGTTDPVPEPRPAVVYGTLVVDPVATASRRGSEWRTDNDDVFQGETNGNGNHVGVAFYGDKPRSLDGATVTAATVSIRRRDRGGLDSAQALTLWLGTETVQPVGAVTLGSTTAGPSLARGQAVEWVLPVSWVQAMVDGTAGSLAVYEADGSPYVILDGRGAWTAAFTLTIEWQRG